MRARVTHLPNPFDPRQAEVTTLCRPRRIRHLAPRQGVVVAVLNGRPVMRAAWRRRLRDGDQLVFASLPAGGGGRGGSNPLRTLLTIALIAWTGGAGFAGMMGQLGFGALATRFAGLAVTMAGMSVINALMPIRPPAGLPAPSPTYSIEAQGNAARIGAVIPVQYGRMLSWPDLAALPYTEYFGEDQYVYQLICLGAGDYQVEEIRIEDTPVTAFSEIQTEVVAPGATVTLFPTAVVTSTEVSGQELKGMKTASWTASGSTVTIAESAHGRASGQYVHVSAVTGTATAGDYAITGVTDADHYTITAAGFGASGTAQVLTLFGGITGFVASGPGTVARQIGIDLVLPNGLYLAGDSGVVAPGTTGPWAVRSAAISIEAQPVDDLGAPTGAWAALGTIYLNDRTNTPIRRSYRYDVAPGRYRIRAWRVDKPDTSDSGGHEILIAGLRSYLSAPANFPGVTLIALRMRATNNLSLQASRRISVVATRKLPVWSGSAWSAPVATRSIAWAIADAARSGTYGPALADREIDLAALLALDAVWTARGDAFDFRFDQSGTWWDAVQRIARAGRAQCAMQGGILRTVRDGPASVPVAMFSERNMAAGSFGLSYVHQTADTADKVRAKYWDAQTWSEQTITAQMPGATAVKAATVSIDGVTTRAQAQRDATFLAAVNARRRRIVKFETEMEGRLPMFGDLISIQHSMPGWGQQAEARAWDAATRALTLSEPMVWTAGHAHSVILRRPGGSAWGPVVVTRGASDYELILPSTPDFAPSIGTDRVRTHASFGPDQTWAALAKVARVTPRSLYDYEIEAVIEDPAVHTADLGLTPPAITYSQLPGQAVQPMVRDLIGRRVAGSAVRVLISWSPAPNAESYQVEMAEGDDPGDTAVSWTRIADTTSSAIAADLLYAARTLVRIRGIGLAAGPWIVVAVGDLITEFWPTDDTPFWGADTDPFWSN